MLFSGLINVATLAAAGVGLVPGTTSSSLASSMVSHPTKEEEKMAAMLDQSSAEVLASFIFTPAPSPTSTPPANTLYPTTLPPSSFLSTMVTPSTTTAPAGVVCPTGEAASGQACQPTATTS